MTCLVSRGVGRVLMVLTAAPLLATAVITASPGADAATTYTEQEANRNGVDTFSNYHNASGAGPHIPYDMTVQVTCRVLDGTIESVNPDGYWYRIASDPWNDAYYAPANTFLNGDPHDGPYSRNTDPSVPVCGGEPQSPPATPGPVLNPNPGPAVPHDARPTGAIGRPHPVTVTPRHAQGRKPRLPNSLTAKFAALIQQCQNAHFHTCLAFGLHYLDRSGTEKTVDLSKLLGEFRNVRSDAQDALRVAVAQQLPQLKTVPVDGGKTFVLDSGWRGSHFGGINDAHFAVGGMSLRSFGDVWIGPSDNKGKRPVQIRYRTFLNDVYNFDIGKEFGSFHYLVDENRASEFYTWGDTKIQTVSTARSVLNPNTLTLRY